jgi:hypothetical protein
VRHTRPCFNSFEIYELVCAATPSFTELRESLLSQSR